MPSGKEKRNTLAGQETAFGSLRLIIKGSKLRAKKSGMQFDLDEQWLQSKKSIVNCEASGLKLSLGTTKSPASVSIERVDSSRGYTKDNVIVSSLIYNLCKSNFSEADVAAFCLGYVTHNKLITPARIPMKKKIILLGFGRHGKDSAAEYLRDKYGLTFKSSSEFVGQKAVWPLMCYEYESFDECFADRHSRRAEWFNAISEYNREDPARLGKELFSEFDLYVGLRSKRELDALRAQGVFDLAIWIDGSRRLPPEDSSSITITPDMADMTIDNNGTLADLHRRLDALAKTIGLNAKKLEPIR